MTRILAVVLVFCLICVVESETTTLLAQYARETPVVVHHETFGGKFTLF